VQIGALTTWSQIACGGFHNLAIKTDGALWSWGSNNAGRLGLNDTVNRSSPVQIGSLTTWSKVAGGIANSLAIKTDGALWSWGFNSSGQLGLNDVVTRSSPVQVGTLTNWVTLPKMPFSSSPLAIKTT
jgi:alpha-tubulin suppressor-like RCC1 family protein